MAENKIERRLERLRQPVREREWCLSPNEDLKMNSNN